MLIKVYIFWSIFDNFEWNFGNIYCFGLIIIDWVIMERVNIVVVDFYEEVCCNNVIIVQGFGVSYVMQMKCLNY